MVRLFFDEATLSEGSTTVPLTESLSPVLLALSCFTPFASSANLTERARTRVSLNALGMQVIEAPRTLR